ncbi:MAG: exodeoxyribonuclease VII large subunit [Burkholderiaceae bacterium]
MNPQSNESQADLAADRRVVLPVATLNRQVARLLERSFPLVWVVGEVSNLTRAASGHCYFSLKDAQAQVRAVMFRSRVRAVGQLLRNGQRVEALAAVSLYEARGDFQLNVESLRLAGAGDLHQAFVALRDRLQAEGLFDESLKRPLPRRVSTVGVVTSLQAAALRDVLATLAARAPQVEVIVYPSAVQGVEAPAALVRALAAAADHALADVLLLVRGGGSLEDLWAFNDEQLARAIRRSPIPVVAGVGHESDVTIADFAADRRAATPTAAAAAAVTDRRESVAQLRGLVQRLLRAGQRQHEQRWQRLDLALRGLPAPWLQWRARRDRLGRAAVGLSRAGRHTLADAVARLARRERDLRAPDLRAADVRVAHAATRLSVAIDRALERARAREAAAAGRLAAISPQAVLERGYAVLTDAGGQVLTGIGQVAVGASIEARLADGHLSATVTGRKGKDR